MRFFCYLLSFLFALYLMPAQGQEQRQRIMFYNVENLFRPVISDSTSQIDSNASITPYWHYGRYRDKLFRIGQVIVAVGQWNPPMLVGLCEIDCREVLTDLIHLTSLKQLGYGVVHFESSDIRGADVGLLYRKELFHLIAQQPIQVPLALSKGAFSRDILYVKGEVCSSDTLHLFVCHFPSRRGGEMKSEPNRIAAARVLRELVDSIIRNESQPQILIMGDFNDTPTDRALTEVLGAKSIGHHLTINHLQLYNLADSLQHHGQTGSYKYQGRWQMLDQILVSGALLTSKSIIVAPQHEQLFMAPWLLIPDDKFYGNKPFRTFQGWTYLGGYSDHLPIYIDLWCGKNNGH